MQLISISFRAIYRQLPMIDKLSTTRIFFESTPKTHDLPSVLLIQRPCLPCFSEFSSSFSRTKLMIQFPCCNWLNKNLQLGIIRVNITHFYVSSIQIPSNMDLKSYHLKLFEHQIWASISCWKFKTHLWIRLENRTAFAAGFMLVNLLSILSSWIRCSISSFSIVS